MTIVQLTTLTIKTEIQSKIELGRTKLRYKSFIVSTLKVHVLIQYSEFTKFGIC